jgi:DNA-directed RNA polymerase alpha subunit
MVPDDVLRHRVGIVELQRKKRSQQRRLRRSEELLRNFRRYVVSRFKGE